MIERKRIEIDNQTFVISKIPAIAAREIITQYLPTAAPKIGDYKTNEALMLKMMAYVAVLVSGEEIPLISPILVDKHIPNWEVLIKIEKAMIEYNCSFFHDGSALSFFDNLNKTLPQWITKILKDSLGQLSQAEKQPSTN